MRKPRGNGSSPRGPQGSGVAGLFVVPRLEELVVDPGKAGVLDTRTARIVATQGTGRIHGILLPIARSGRRPATLATRQARCRAGGTGQQSSSRILPELDDVVSVEEVAAHPRQAAKVDHSERLTLAVRDCGYLGSTTSVPGLY